MYLFPHGCALWSQYSPDADSPSAYSTSYSHPTCSRRWGCTLDPQVSPSSFFMHWEQLQLPLPLLSHHWQAILLPVQSYSNRISFQSHNVSSFSNNSNHTHKALTQPPVASHTHTHQTVTIMGKIRSTLMACTVFVCVPQIRWTSFSYI